MLLQKENDQKNVNKRDANNEPSCKFDRLLLVKKISNGEDKENRELKFLRNSK